MASSRGEPLINPKRAVRVPAWRGGADCGAEGATGEASSSTLGASFTKQATQFDSPGTTPCVMVIVESNCSATPMLQITQADVRTALANAVSARHKAEAATTPEMRAFWLNREAK